MRFRSVASALAVCMMVVFLAGAPARAAKKPAEGATSQIPHRDLLQPRELVSLMRSPDKPLVLQVGSHTLFQEAHVPGAQYAGPAGQPQGVDLLKQRVSGLKKTQFIVVYCGCCPWQKCPNIRPAYRELKQMGFTHVMAMYIADNFGTNWVQKGYPVARGD
jgi:thiosulfate/3-mercaptopyruvate sulfurtransferase